MKLEITGLTFSYGTKSIISGLDFSLEEGEFVSILGPSGCGKSTVLKLLTGVLKADGGSVFLDGKEVKDRGACFAYMPQNDLLFPWKNILDNVCLYGRIHGQQEQMKAEAMARFPIFGLEGYEKAYPSALSGGMRQRAAFLRTSLMPASVMLLDEPFGALDVITRGQMQDWLLSMRESLNRTVLLVTHDMDEAIYLSDRILIMGQAPSSSVRQILVEEPQANRTRDWLYGQSSLRRQIYHEISRMGEAL